MAKGGKQPGAGRPKGRKDDKTLKKEAIFKAVQDRIMRNAQRILDRQLALSEGCSYLMKMTTTNKGKKKVAIVTDPSVITKYLDGTLDDEKEDKEYYYITADKPDNKALQDLLDRAFGKAPQSIDHTTKGDAIGFFGQAADQLKDA